MSYDHRFVEKKWQSVWKEKKTYKASVDYKKPKYYVLDMFPYPSGAGLHVGHVTGYTGTDIIARYKRQCGFNVLHPMGWDSFGLPAEQYAIRTGTHPAIITKKNIATYQRQLESLGFSYDWDREIATSDPSYYKWTQWIFTLLYKKGLAYEAEVSVNFCPDLGTVLANEEVEGGKSVLGGYPVIKKPLRQWILKITKYADRLIEDLHLADWPETSRESTIRSPPETCKGHCCAVSDWEYGGPSLARVAGECASPPQMASGYAPELEDQKKPAHELVERIANGLRSAGFKVETAVEVGDIRETIIDAAAESAADLIVVGSHGQREASSAFCSAAWPNSSLAMPSAR